MHPETDALVLFGCHLWSNVTNLMTLPIGEVFLFGKSVEIPPLSDIIIFSLSRKEVDSHEKESYPYRTHSFGFAECFLVGISL